MSDVFRKEFGVLTEVQKHRVKIVKEDAEKLYLLMEACCSVSRELAIAKTKLEECVMWAIKDITRIIEEETAPYMETGQGA